MRWASTRVGRLGVLGFAGVWCATTLLAFASGDLDTPEEISTEPFPPGTISDPDRREASCGDIEVHGSVRGAANERPEEFACLRDALASGRRAVLVVRGRSDEDYPMRMQLRVLGTDSLDLLVDTTRDPEGSGSLRHLVCDGIDPVRQQPTDCEPAG